MDKYLQRRDKVSRVIIDNRIVRQINFSSSYVALEIQNPYTLNSGKFDPRCLTLNGKIDLLYFTRSENRITE
jgi:hypothetical protein